MTVIRKNPVRLSTSGYISKRELFLKQAPSFNFELDADELLAKALQVGFVKEIGRDQYEVNENY